MCGKVWTCRSGRSAGTGKPATEATGRGAPEESACTVCHRDECFPGRIPKTNPCAKKSFSFQSVSRRPAAHSRGGAPALSSGHIADQAGKHSAGFSAAHWIVYVRPLEIRSLLVRHCATSTSPAPWKWQASMTTAIRQLKLLPRTEARRSRRQRSAHPPYPSFQAEEASRRPQAAIS